VRVRFTLGLRAGAGSQVAQSAAATTALALSPAPPLPDGSEDIRGYLDRQGVTLDLAVDRRVGGAVPGAPRALSQRRAGRAVGASHQATYRPARRHVPSDRFFIENDGSLGIEPFERPGGLG
jgi:hypothetical protein